MKNNYFCFLIVCLFLLSWGQVNAAPTRPTVSTDANEYWYYIEFSKRECPVGSGNRYLCDQGINKPLIAAPAVDQNGSLWKFVEETPGSGEYKIISKQGNGIAYTSTAIPGTNIANDRYYSKADGGTDLYTIENHATADYFWLKRKGGSGIDKSNGDPQFDVYGSGDGTAVSIIAAENQTKVTAATITTPASFSPTSGLNHSAYHLGDVKSGANKKSQTVNVFGYNLTGPVTCSFSPALGAYEVTPSVLTPDANGMVIATVTVEFTSTSDVDPYTTNLVLSSAGTTENVLFTCAGPFMLSPTVANDGATDQWYYLYYNKRTHYVLTAMGEGNRIEARLPQLNEPSQLWKVVSAAGDARKYKLISKTGQQIVYPSSQAANLFGTTSSSTSTFSFTINNYLHGQIKCNEIGSSGSYINKQNYNPYFTDYTSSPDDGSSVLFIPQAEAPAKLKFDFPTVSTASAEYWYQIQFNRKPANVIADGGVNNQIVQSVKKDTFAPEQYWKITGTENEYKLINYTGHEMKTGTSTVPVASNVPVSANTGEGALHCFQRYGADNSKWLIANMGKTEGSNYLNDGGTIAGFYSADAGSAINFLPVATAIMTDAPDAGINFGTVTVNQDSLITINVVAINVSDNISYEVTGANAGSIQIEPATGWDAKKGGDLKITFAPTAAIASLAGTKIVLKANDSSVLKEISLSGDAIPDQTSAPKIDADPVVSVKYYTLQGIEVGKPTINGVYIVKKIHASQKEEVTKTGFVNQ